MWPSLVRGQMTKMSENGGWRSTEGEDGSPLGRASARTITYSFKQIRTNPMVWGKI